MSKTRILLTGADGLIGSHVLAQLLLQENVSVRAVVESREAAQVLQQQYPRISSSSLDFALVSRQELLVPGVFNNVLRDSSEPFRAVVHTFIPNSSEEADCLARFINLETNTIIGCLKSIQDVAHAIRRVVFVTSLTPFARWLAMPVIDRGSGRPIDLHPSGAVGDTGYVLATSQASNNIIYGSVSTWLRNSGARFELAYITTPNVYGPTVYPLETSTDLSEANRRIWNICSNKPSETTESSLYDISYFVDVRDLAIASVRALFVPQAANKHFAISSGIMPSDSQIAAYLNAHFPELRGRIQIDESPPPQRQLDDPSLDFLNTYLVSSVLDISLRPAEATIVDTTRQILDLQQRKTWKSVTQS